jgi:23S rRNA pseudouridine1911/1915/1917 synthase
MPEQIRRTAVVPPESAGSRLDQALATLFPEFSRSRLQQWIKEGAVEVDGRVLRPKDKLFGGETIVLNAVVELSDAVQPQDIGLNLLYEDDQILVVDKPVGLVVHPGAGNAEGTLQNALLHHEPGLAGVPRAGIVHRLDKDTSGLMVVAKTLQAHAALVEQLQARTVKREYMALVNGTFTGGGKVDAPIDRHPRDRVRMAVVETGREAITHYRIAKRFLAHTLLRVALETGRTHQIRVHMAYIGHPLVGDPVYGGRMMLPKGASDTVREALRGFRRQALHATRLALTHPASGEEMSWETPMPADMQALLATLEQESPWQPEHDDARY